MRFCKSSISRLCSAKSRFSILSNPSVTFLSSACTSSLLAMVRIINSAKSSIVFISLFICIQDQFLASGLYAQLLFDHVNAAFAHMVTTSWVFVIFCDSGSRKHNCHVRGESGGLENPCESMEQ
jgi:hypothetical protein